MSLRWLPILFISLWLRCSAGCALPAPESFVPSLLAAWRADTLSGSDLVDLSGNGHTLTANSVSYGTTSTANGWGLNGVAVAETNGLSSHYDAASAAPWAPLNDGTGASFWTIFRVNASAGIRVLFDTGAAVPNVNGAYVLIDTDLGRVGIDFTKNLGDGTVTFPADSGRIIDYTSGSRFSWKGSFAIGVPHVLVVTIGTSDTPDIKLWLDGHLLDSLSIGDREKGVSDITVVPTAEPRNFNTGAPGFPLRLFAYAHSVFDVLGCELGEAGASAAILSTPNRQAIEDWAVSHYGVPLDRTEPGILVWDGNSLVDNVWHPYPIWEQFPELVTPNLRKPTRNVMRAVAGLETNQMSARAAKHVTPMFDSTKPFNILVAWEFVNELADGATKETAYANYVAYCLARRAEGWKVVSGTMEPNRFAGGLAEAGVPGPIGKANFLWLRDQVRLNWSSFSDALADITVDPIVGDWDAMVSDYGAGSGPKVYRADGTHFTIAGNVLVEPYFTAAINSLFKQPVIVRKR